MSEFEPTQEAIDKVLEKYTPEQIARAYLKASRRAKDYQAAFDVLGGINDAMFGAATKDYRGGLEGLEKARSALRTHKQVTE